MSRRLLADNLVAEVRSMLDEENRENISDTDDILPALNRAQDYGANILARHYEEPLLTYKTVMTTSGTSEYDIPEDAFEERLEKVEVSVEDGYFYEVTRISYRDITAYETDTQNNIPYYYAIVGNKYRLVPSPTGVYTLRIWYTQDPEPLVLSQGRITSVDTDNNYVIVDSTGSDLTTEIDNLNCFVNVVDGQSGKIKGSFQIKSISSTQINFKTSPDRTSVLNKTIGTSLADLGIAKDDILCTIHGNCVPVIKKPLSNFLIQYATSEIRRKLDGQVGADQIILDKLEQQVERSWVGREQTRRVKRRSNKWSLPLRRWYSNR